MSNANTSVIPVIGEEYWGIDGSIVLYGVIVDILMIVPIALYIVLDDTNLWAQNHQTYINMIYSAFAPLGISWWIVLVDDSQTARTVLKGAIEVAGTGPFMLLWVGMATQLMSAHDNSHLSSANYQVWMFGFFYLILNIVLIAMHYHIAPVM